MSCTQSVFLQRTDYILSSSTQTDELVLSDQLYHTLLRLHFQWLWMKAENSFESRLDLSEEGNIDSDSVSQCRLCECTSLSF